MRMPHRMEPRRKEQNCATRKPSVMPSARSTPRVVTRPVTLPIVLENRPSPQALTKPAMKARSAVHTWTSGETAFSFFFLSADGVMLSGTTDAGEGVSERMLFA